MTAAIGTTRRALGAASGSLQAALWLPVGHLAFVSLAGSLPLPPPSKGSPRHSFVVLIPARNEEANVCAAVESALRSSYADGMRRVIVIADNCTDGTAARARASGAEVWERFDRARANKGAALQWALERLRDEPGWEAVVVLDADATVSAGFLTAVDRRLAEGACVVQGERYVTNAGDNVVSRLAQVSSAAQCVLRPRGRTRLGGAAKLVGNGMVFHRRVLEDCPWRVEGLAEDFEYWLQLLEHGIHPVHEPAAVVSDLMPTSLGSARVQRARWEAGRLTLLRRHLAGRRFGAALRDPVLLEALVAELVFPNLSVTAAAILGTGLARWAAERRGASTAALQCGVLVGHVVLALRAAGAPRAAYASLALAPVAVGWRLWVTVEAAVRGKKLEWQGTPRSPEARPQQRLSGASER